MSSSDQPLSGVERLSSGDISDDPLDVTLQYSHGAPLPITLDVNPEPGYNLDESL